MQYKPYPTDMVDRPTYPQSLDQFASEKLAKIEDAALTRRTRPTGRGEKMSATREGHNLISFADNDFLGLSTDKRVRAAAAKAATDFGGGSGASRLVTGEHPLYTELETAIARFKGTEAAIVFGSGFLTNIGVIPTLVGKTDLIIADERVHASMHAGIKLSGAALLLFDHNDADHARELLEQERSNYRNTLVLVEGVYSMDGDVSPLKALAEAANDHDSWLLVDDAHGFGTLGMGRGTAHEQDVASLIPLHMGTLSKAIGSYGGYLAASEQVISLIKNRARSLIYTTALPPAVLAASIESLKIITKDKDRTQKPLEHAKAFARELGLPIPQSAIVPMIIGRAESALEASAALERDGFIVTAFRPPTVEEGTSRLRFCFSATHTKEDIAKLIKAIRSLNLQGDA